MNPVQDRSKFEKILEIFKTISKSNLFDKEQQLNNNFYHHPLKQCDLIKQYGEGKRFKRIIYQFCKTHNVKVCRCGWEFGYHYGKQAFWKEEEVKKPQEYCHCGRKGLNIYVEPIILANIEKKRKM